MFGIAKPDLFLGSIRVFHPILGDSRAQKSLIIFFKGSDLFLCHHGLEGSGQVKNVTQDMPMSGHSLLIIKSQMMGGPKHLNFFCVF